MLNWYEYTQRHSFLKKKKLTLKCTFKYKIRDEFKITKQVVGKEGPT